MPIALAVLILCHRADWPDWFAYLAWWIAEEDRKERGWSVPKYIRNWRAYQGALTRKNGRRPGPDAPILPLGALAAEFGYGPEDFTDDPETGIRTIHNARLFSVSLVPDTAENRAAGAHPIQSVRVVDFREDEATDPAPPIVPKEQGRLF